MSDILQVETLLVPVDFSRPSRHAFKCACELADGENPVVILMHVLDERTVETAVENGWGKEDELTKQLRDRAQADMDEMVRSASSCAEIDTIVSKGEPFVEILRRSRDFAVDAIVIGKVGIRSRFDKLMFGSTAEKVLRGSQVPVIVVPLDE